MRVAVLLFGAVLAGCLCSSSGGGENSAGRSPQAPEPSSVAPVVASIDAPSSQALEVIESVEIKVVNRSRNPGKLDITHGPLSALKVAGEDGSLGPLLLDDPQMHCRCECQPGMRCPDCEPPVDEFVDLALEDEHVFKWNGKVGRFKKEGKYGYCMETFPPPAGNYIFKICEKGHEFCGVEEIQLPLREPLEISLIALERAKMSCSSLSKKHMSRVAKMALVRMELMGKGPDVSSCQVTDARCVNTKDRDKLALGKGCRIAVIPTNAWTEVVVITKEDAYSTFFDPDGVYVMKVDTTPLS